MTYSHIHPIYFGIMIIMNLGIGNITPLVGSALFFRLFRGGH